MSGNKLFGFATTYTALAGGQALHKGRKTQPLPGLTVSADRSAHRASWADKSLGFSPSIDLPSQLSGAVSHGTFPLAGNPAKTPSALGCLCLIQSKAEI